MSSTDLHALEGAVALERPAPARAHWRPSLRAGAWLFWALLAGNGAFIVWMWLHAGGISGVHGRAEAFTSLGRITGLLGVYLALVQVLMISRLPPLERFVGFDRLTGWHRLNGKVCVSLIIAHAVLITIGYALAERISVPSELSRLLSSYPGMVTATIGTALMVAVVISSLVIVRRRMRYETWHLVHFLIYAGIALGYLHQIPTGNEFAAHPVQADYWISLYVVTLAVLLLFRVALPLRNFFRYELKVTRVAPAAPGVTSIEVGGRGLDRLHAVAGQFMVWRFLTPGRWWQAHPFSLSAMPDGRALRLTAKAVGDFTGELPALEPGTRVMVEGPFGVLISAAMRTRKALLIAGGIGITPLRALFEEMAGSTDVVLIYRVVSKREFVLRDELEEIAARWHATLHLLPGDHRRREGAKLLAPAGLGSLVRDIAERDVYVCGPPAMMDQVRASLAELSVPEDQIHSERFALAA
jgi:predicted ferric reductase